MDRRRFLQSSALLGGSLVAARLGLTFWEDSVAQAAAWPEAGAYVHHRPENQLYGVCQQCNANCGIKVKLVDGRVSKIDGNPYNPWTLTPHLPYDTKPAEAALVEGAICPKGQAGIQALYDPYRLVKVLKRAGKRGENKWKTIDFETALKEIVDGGDLFGEGRVEGLKDIQVLKDPALAEALAKDAAKVAAKEMTLDDFKTKHQAQLGNLTDPDHPDLGPKNNQLCLNWGRMKAGREQMYRRFGQGFGTVNAHGHTTVCQGSLYFTCKAISDQFVDGKWDAGSKFYWQGDIGNSEFVLFVGANPFDTNYGPPHRTPKITSGLADGGLRIAVIDPRLSKAASKAWKWLPVKPNGVGAAALAMIHWIIENNRYDARYLANANLAAAKADNEPTWTQTAWLVKLDDKGRPGPFLRASDLGLPTEARKNKAGQEWTFDPFIVSKGGQFIPFDPNDDANPVEGDLLVDAEANGVRVKTVFTVRKPIWLNWPGNSPATANGPWLTSTGASPSIPRASTMFWPGCSSTSSSATTTGWGAFARPPRITSWATAPGSRITCPRSAARSRATAWTSSGAARCTTNPPSSPAFPRSGPGTPSVRTSTRKSSLVSAMRTLIPSRP
jgi:anaerobic selenocysteine-containing dehydrogenase